MPEVLTLSEHEVLRIVERRSRGEKALDQNHARTLEALKSRNSLPTQSFTWGNGCIKFGQFCGVICLGSLTLEILPKIYGLEINPEASRAALIRMLSKAFQIRLNGSGFASVNLQKSYLLDFFIEQFCNQLRAELLQGVIRNYVEKSQNLNVLRGKLQIEQQLKHNLAKQHRLYCAYDEFCHNNLHNQVLKYVLEILLKLVRSGRVQLLVTELLMRLDSVKRTRVTASLFKSLTFNRTSARYISIFNQCKWYLDGYHPDVVAGKADCFALLFDMNQLFEAYVGYILKKQAYIDGLHIRLQGPQRYLARRMDTEQAVFMMKPDFSFLSDDTRIVAIADSKWKRLDESDNKFGISQSDLYQMQSYAVAYRVTQLYLIYPKQIKLTKQVHFLLEGSGVRVTIVPFDLTIPELQEVPGLEL